MPVANIAEQEFKNKYWAAHDTNPWARRRERAKASWGLAQAAARHAQKLSVPSYKKRYETARQAEARAMTRMVNHTRGQLRNLLTDALLVEPGINIRGLGGARSYDPVPPPHLAERLPEPQWSDFAPEPLPFQLGRFPLFRPLEQARRRGTDRRFDKAHRAWQQAEDERKMKLAEAELAIEAERVKNQDQIKFENNELQEFRRNLSGGDRTTTSEYFHTVLETLAWPQGFPRKVSAAYHPTRTHLDVQFQLPTKEIVPRVEAYGYETERDRITQELAPEAKRDELYESVVAQVALRILYELFGSDPYNLLSSISLVGWTSTDDRASGQHVEPYLVSATVRFNDFARVRLDKVDPMACLQVLARTS